MVCEPHAGIISQTKTAALDLSAKKSESTRQISTELVQGSYRHLMNDIQVLRRHSSELSQMIALRRGEEEVTRLNLANREFFWHPVMLEDFSKSRYLEKVLFKVCDIKPGNYEKLLSLEGVGPKTMRALSLVSEVVYGARPSYEDPARYSFAHGGKDGTPYPVDRKTYDSTINFFSRLVQKMRVPFYEKRKIMTRLKEKEKKEEKRGTDTYFCSRLIRSRFLGRLTQNGRTQNVIINAKEIITYRTSGKIDDNEITAIKKILLANQ
jgi:hypothetical protein